MPTGDASIFRVADNTLALATASTERMRIDSSGNVGIGTGASIDAPLHVQYTGTGSGLVLESTEAGASNAPDLVLYRNSSSPADSDDIGNILFKGKDDGGNDTSYAFIMGEINDASNGSEDGNLFFRTISGGSLDNRLSIVSNNIGIGTDSPSAGLHTIVDNNPVAEFSRGSNNTTNINLDYNTTLTGQISAANAEFQISASGSSTPLEFFTNGAERMRIDSSGKVSIGTTSTTAPLRVKVATDANFAVQNTSSTVQLQGINDAANAFTTIDIAGNPIKFSANGSESMRIDSSGMLLVNTTSSWGGETTPHIESRGDVAGDYTGLIVSNTNDAASDSVSVNFGLARDGGLVFGNAGKITVGKEQDWTSTPSTVDGFMSFSTMGNETLTERVRINSAGNVGIGNTSPTEKLAVHGAIQSSSTGNFNGGTEGVFIDYNSSTGIGKIQCASWGSAYKTLDLQAVAHVFSTGSGSTTERMRIDSDGKVGINTSNPVGNGLTINTASNGSEANPILFLGGDVGYALTFFLDGTAAYMGQNSGSRALRFYSGAETAGVNLAAGGTSFGTFSDERLKENIKDIGSVTEKIKDIRCVSFNRTDIEDSKETIGFIAQDFIGKFDQVLDKTKLKDGDEEEYYSIKYTETIPVLLKAIQEQQTQIDALQSEINLLKGE